MNPPPREFPANETHLVESSEEPQTCFIFLFISNSLGCLFFLHFCRLQDFMLISFIIQNLWMTATLRGSYLPEARGGHTSHRRTHGSRHVWNNVEIRQIHAAQKLWLCRYDVQACTDIQLTTCESISCQKLQCSDRTLDKTFSTESERIFLYMLLYCQEKWFQE